MKRDKTLLKTALLWAEESVCERLKVGAVLAKDERIISIGFNGTPQGLTKSIKKDCDLCNGTGIYQNETCFNCGGVGYIENNVSDNNCEIHRYRCLNCEEKFDNFIEEKDFKMCPHCNEIIEVKKDNKVISKNYLDVYETNTNVIHAEMNALMFAAKQGISTNGATMYVTHSPCINCAKHILQAGIKRLVYAEDYRDNSGIELLKSKIKVDKIVFG